MFEEDIEKIIEHLAALVEERRKFKAKIWTNAKGEASFEVRVSSDDQQEIIDKSNDLLKGVLKICKDNSIPVAGLSQ